jgi:hypothetical protein
VSEVPAFYRVVRTNPPTAEDFRSDREQGRPRPGPRWAHTWHGFSVMDSEAGARQLVSEYPRIGSYIATITVEEGSGIRIERTHNREGHYTMWGIPETVLAHVQSVIAAEERGDDHL